MARARSITGAAAVYSFYPTKNVGGIGDGGAVATDDESLAARVRRLRVHGMTEQYVHVDISQNFRMSEIEAAFIRLQLARLDVDNSRRRAIARRYRQGAQTWDGTPPSRQGSIFASRVADATGSRGAPRRGRTAVHYTLALTQQPACAGDKAVPKPRPGRRDDQVP